MYSPVSPVTLFSIDYCHLPVSVDLFIIITLLNGFFSGITFLSSLIVDKKCIVKCFAILIAKFLGLFLYFLLGLILLFVINDNKIVFILTCSPIILSSLKELKVIGDKLELRLGKKIYVFSLVSTIFNILELKFLKQLEKKE